MAIDESWVKIERWLASYAPDEKLPGPCGRSALDRLYERIGARLPEDVELSWLRHDGSGLVTIIPPGFQLYHIDAITNEVGREPDALAITIGNLGPTQLVAATRTGRIGTWDATEGYVWEEDALWASFARVLELVGNVLDSTPPWIAVLPGDEEWEATHDDPDFPGTLAWTEEPREEAEWDCKRLNREFGFGKDD